jgi:hypothetical protein
MSSSSMIMIEIFHCDCNPQFTYKNKQSFKNHFQSIRHQNWQHESNDQHYRRRITELENTISSLKVERNMWKDMAVRLKQQYEPSCFLD